MPRSLKRTADGAASPDFSPWARVNAGLEDYNISVKTRVHTGVTGSYSIQYTNDNPEEFVKAKYARALTVLTITLEDHGLNAGDGVNLQGTPWDSNNGQSLAVATTPTTDTFTVTVADTGGTVGSLKVAPLCINDLDNFSGVTGNQAGRTESAVQMLRVAKDGGGLTGKVTLIVTQSYGS